MTYQTQSNAYIAFMAQSALGSPASGAGATILRTRGGQGGRLSKAAVSSEEVRRDGMSTRGRHGSQKTAGSYDCELSLGLMDEVLQAVMRGTWGSADLALTSADFTSITTTTNTIIAAGGSWITMGLKVGDIVRLTGAATTANNNLNLRITGLTATTITVAEAITLDATADAGATLTRKGRVLINPAAGSIIKRYFTIEEYEVDIDSSEVFQDCFWGKVMMSMKPNGLVDISPSWVGTGQFATDSGASAPIFTTPTQPTGEPLAAIDAKLRFGSGSSDFVDLTSFDVTLDTTPAAPDVIASKFAPDVFEGQMQVSMNLTMLRKDLAEVIDFLDETPLSLHFLAEENTADPKSFVGLYVPNFTLGSVDKSALVKTGGPRTQTISVPAALVGIDETGGAYDSTMVKWQVSNAS